ncbi:MAG TPA: HU family DNA-binding protein [Firmicutes bacterium]|nr:HU family DNA-binding protein [Bacillota bacterium]
MNKADLVSVVAQKSGMTKRDADRAVTATFEAIHEELERGGKVAVVGFGSFEVRTRAARKGRNPRTGEEISIAPVKAPVFKAGKALKDAVAG